MLITLINHQTIIIMRRILTLGIVMSCFLITSCASFLNGKQQSVQINTPSPETKVYVNDKFEGQGLNVTTSLPRNAGTQQIKFTRDGFKDSNFVIYQTKKSPLYILSWVPFGVLLYPPFLDVGPKSYDYNKEISFDKEPQQFTERLSSEKYVYMKNASFDVEENAMQIKKVKENHYLQGKDKIKDFSSNEEKIEFDNTIFSTTLSELLKKYNYIDTTGTILKKKTNSLYVNAKVKNVEFFDIYKRSARAYHSYLVTNVLIDWELTDIYDQTKFTKTIEGESGEFNFTASTDKDAVVNSLDDAITSSFIKFISENEFKKYLDEDPSEKIEFESIALKKGKQPKNMEQSMKASVTIKAADGHGSGFLVSNDGYILTNLHVVAGTEDLIVITNDSKSYSAKMIRKNENKDLALIKVDNAFEYSFNISDQKNYKIGEDIFAIGTPNSIQLGQTLSKGIISGERISEEEKFIQTDASVNSGNSGGPLINKNGELLGVVNSKLLGIGVEGIGFAIPASEIQNALYIN